MINLTIPNLLPPHMDESIYSYAYRLGRVNGHNSLHAFLKSLQTGKDATDFHANWTYDGYRILAPLLGLLEPSARTEIIQNCSYYPFQAVFLTRHQQAIITDRLFNGTKSKKSIRQSALVTQLNACTKCMNEDWKEHGHYYLHRSHNLPDVTVCHKHHIPLNRLKDGSLLEPAPDAIEYAVFSAGLLSAGLETNIDTIWQATRNRIPDRVPGLTTPLEKILKNNLYITRNQDVPNIIRILLQTFGSVINLASCLKEDNETTRRFAEKIITDNEYEVFRPFSPVLVQMRHKYCGSTFFTTPEGFLRGWKCPRCHGRQEEPKYKEPEERVKALVGDEYTVIQVHKGRNTTAEIRHNPCETIKTYNIKHFAAGLRCPKCTTLIPASAFPDIVQHMTNGQYKVTRKRGRNRYEITEENGGAVELTPQLFLQEILRPTPSDILPAPVQYLTKDWGQSVFHQQVKQPSRISSKDFLTYLKTLYNKDDLIFIEDLHKTLPKEYKQVLLGSLSRLYKTKQLYRAGKGIYSLQPSQVNPMEILIQRTLIRKGNHIGIYNGKSLAYEIGILKEKPSTISIMSNTFTSGTYKSSTPTYKCTMYGLSVSFTTSPITIGDNNYLYLMALQALRYCNHYGHEGLPYVTRFIRQHQLSAKGFESLLPYYTERVQKQLKTILEKSCGKSQKKEN